MPFITQAYRLGSAHNRTRTTHTDVVATFADKRTKNKILTLARERGFLMYKQDQMYVFLDLTSETIQKKKEMKELLAALNDVNIRHLLNCKSSIREKPTLPKRKKKDMIF